MMVKLFEVMHFSMFQPRMQALLLSPFGVRVKNENDGGIRPTGAALYF